MEVEMVNDGVKEAESIYNHFLPEKELKVKKYN